MQEFSQAIYRTLLPEKVTLVPSQLLIFTVTGFCGYDGALFLSDIIASGFHGYDKSLVDIRHHYIPSVRNEQNVSFVWFQILFYNVV